MVTNVPAAILNAENIRKVYAIRWQIELLFKVWKSQVTINEFTATSNINRFECQLYGKLIWIILNLYIFNWLQQRVYQNTGFLCSVWKYFKLIMTLSEKLIESIKTPGKIIRLIDELVEIAPKLLYLEKKKGKGSLNQLIKHLA